jgi:hypothetical protein
MDGSERLRFGLLLTAALALAGLGCRGTPQPVTRTPPADATKDVKAPPAAAISPKTPDSTPAAAAPPEETRKGDAAPVVVDAGVDTSTTPATLVEAAHAERERRAGAGKSIAVINDKTLPRYAAKGQITVADPKASKDNKKKGPSAADAAAAAQARDEEYWRSHSRNLRDVWRQAADEVKELEQKSGELRLRFYAEGDSFLRDTQIKPDWDRVLDRLRQARVDVDTAKQDLAKFLDEGRAAGAQPGWLDEGIENEPEEPKKKEKDKDSNSAMQAIEPPVLNDDSIRTPPPSVSDRR